MATSTDSSKHVLDAAERLFLERGYAGTRLNDIAGALGIKSASLYHHAPGGKEDLWTRVMDRSLQRHHVNLRAAATEAGDDLRAQLVAMADWLVSQPPMNVVALASSDLPSTPQPQAHGIAGKIYAGIMLPVTDVFRGAVERGDIKDVSPELLAGMFVASINALVPAEHAGVLPKTAREFAEDTVDVLLDGIRSPD